MASGFPGSIDSFTNPLTTSPLNSPSHAGQHQDLNDAVNKIETYMGLVKVTAQAITAASTLTISNCFSSLYDNYRIVVSGLQSPTQQFVNCTLSSGSAYTSCIDYKKYDGTGAGSNISTSNIQLGLSGANAGNCIIFDVTAPFLSIPTTFSGMNEGGNYFGVFHGRQTSNTSSTGLVMDWRDTVTATGYVRVYGYRN